MARPDDAAPRTRNAAATRAAILAAARSRFAEEGYDLASIRGIAGDAGIDPALVLRYFGSKEDLFAAVIGEGGSIQDLLAGDRAEFGRRAARALLIDPVLQHKLQNLLVILRSASSPKAGPVIRDNLRNTFYGPLEAWLGGEDAVLKARAIGVLVIGAAMGRAIDNNGLDDPAERERLCERLAEALQRAVD